MRNAFVCAVLLAIVSACSEAPSSEPAGGNDASGAGLAGTSGSAPTSGGGGALGLGGSPTAPTSCGAGAGGLAGNSAGQSPSQAGESVGGTAGSGASSQCNPRLSDSNRTLVATALDALFVDKQVSAIDQYWADPYLQHNPIAKSGVATFESIMGPLVTSPSFSFERLRTLAECDLVVVQGRYSGTGVIFDMFRIESGKLVEHWDSDANQASDASGPTENPPTPDTSANRAKVLAFMQSVLIEKHADASQFLSSNFVVHRTPTASGPTALLDYQTAEAITYSKVHHVIADGSFVFTLAEGTRNGMPYGLYDLFRLESAQIVEHWDSRRPVPTSTASGLGIF
jgi:predicted SnoaL-like aldol condensation-catalyzing enzyme